MRLQPKTIYPVYILAPAYCQVVQASYKKKLLKFAEMGFKENLCYSQTSCQEKSISIYQKYRSIHMPDDIALLHDGSLA
jgi:hypothetical protein